MFIDSRKTHRALRQEGNVYRPRGETHQPSVRRAMSYERGSQGQNYTLAGGEMIFFLPASPSGGYGHLPVHIPWHAQAAGYGAAHRFILRVDEPSPPKL